MQQLYPLFYTQAGTRRLNQLQTPLINDLAGFPRASVLHYYREADTEIIDVTQPYFKGYANKIQVDYPDTLISPIGHARKMSTPVLSLVRAFHQANKTYQYRKNAVELVSDTQMLTVLDYNLLEKVYNYQYRSMLVAHDKWYDIHSTMLSTIDAACQSTSKNHFMEIELPPLVPSVAMLRNMAGAEFSATTMRTLPTPGHWWVLELWKWFDPELRSTSIFKALTDTNYKRVTLMFRTDDGRFAIINLGYLDSWIKDRPNQTEFPKVQQLKYDMLQKLFLYFCMTVKKKSLESEINPTSGSADSESTPAVKDPEHLDDDTMSHDSDQETHEDDEYGEVTSDTPVSMATDQGSPSEPTYKTVSEIENSDTFSKGKDFLTQLSELDEDLKALDTINRKKLEESGLTVDGTAISDDSEESIVDTLTDQEVEDLVYKDKGTYGVLSHHIERAGEVGILSVSDMRKLQKLVDAQPDTKDPYGSEKTLAQASAIAAGDIEITDESSELVVSSAVNDPSMRRSSLQSYDSDYIRKNMRKDILRAVLATQRAGVIVRKHTIEESHTAMGAFEVHTLELKPIDGQPSTIRAKVPIVNEDGVFKASGSLYSMRKQVVDCPIRKIGPDTVGLTSYYGKVAVSRSTKKANSSLEYVLKQLNAATVSDNPWIKNVAPAQVFDNYFEAPFIYSGISDHFKSFNAGDLHLVFDRSEREKMTTPEQLVKLEKDKRRLVGSGPGGFVVVDTSDHFFLIEKTGAQKPLGDIFDVLKLNRHAAPVDFAEMKLFSKTVPVGLVLGYGLGFRRLLRFLKVRFRKVEGRKQKNLEPYEYAVQFLDKSYIFDRRDKIASMVLAGFGEFEKFLKSRPSTDMDHKAIYVEMLETKGLGSIYVREMELRDQLFVDPITRDTLEGMKEPTTFKGLLVRSCELLLTYYHPDSQDFNVQRIRGYERFAGAIYKNMVVSIRSFRNKNIANKSKVELSPYEVWNTILKDPSVKITEDINPIQNVKESEIVTYVGEGGRAKDSMNKDSRAYHVSDISVVSEASVDSGDVGINFYLSTNPQLANQRGIKRTDAKVEPSSLLSVSAMISPSCSRDDPRRVAFVTHQSSHTVAAIGYSQPRLRTGYEYVIGQRTSGMFCAAAKADGKVVSIDESGIVVQYKDGITKGYPIGRQYGKAEGSIYPHDIVTTVKPGQSFKKGTVLTYNTGFFEPDVFDPAAVVYKGSLTAKTVFYETSQTLEDSSAISTSFGKRMSTFTTKLKSYTVDFKQHLRNVVKPGQQVDPNTILMLIEDEISAGNTSFDDKSLELLSSLSKAAPRSGYLGQVDKIEVFYHGDKSDMSSSIKALADASDRQMLKDRKAIGEPGYTGFVTDDYRVAGTPLALGRAEVRIYITVGNGTGSGDKLVFANQLKSTIGEVMDYTMTTETGHEIEAVFGYRSNAARIVSSAMEMGTSTTLLALMDKQAIELYDN